MIISHKHKFIFIKTRKTAGTSLEIALSKYCGPKDIITPISEPDETIRQELGYRGPQNFEVSIFRYTFKDIARLLYRRRKLKFFNHARAPFIRRYISPGIWHSYYKFCFERNPWDKVVSHFHMRKCQSDNPPESISDFLQKIEVKRLSDYPKYADSSGLLVDKVYLFENLEASVKDIASRLKLSEIPTLPRAKGNFRTDKRHYREVISAESQKIIEKTYQKEIERFHYEW